MARRTFDVIDVTEILVHWQAGRSLNEMSQSLGVDRKTVSYAASGVTDLMPLATLCRGTPEPDSARQNQLPDAA
jgi:hypothetical protein